MWPTDSAANINHVSAKVQQPLVGQDLLIVEDSRSHSVKHTTLGGSPLDEWSARLKYEQPHTDALDHAVTGTGK